MYIIRMDSWKMKRQDLCAQKGIRNFVPEVFWLRFFKGRSDKKESNLDQRCLFFLSIKSWLVDLHKQTTLLDSVGRGWIPEG